MQESPVNPKNKRGKLPAQFILATVIIALFVVGILLLAPRKEATSSNKSSASEIIIDGTIESDEVDVASKLPGRLAKVLVEEGDEVQAGQVVAILDVPELDAKEEQGTAMFYAAQDQLAMGNLAVTMESNKSSQQIAQAEAGVTSAQAVVEMARTKVTALENGARPQEKAQAAAGVDAARATLAMAQARLSALQEGLRPQELANAAEAVTGAEATLAMAQAKLSALQEGARPQEITQAAQAVNAAQAAYDTAKKSWQRVKGLADDGLIAQQKADEAEMAYRSADAQLQAAQAKYDLVKAGARTQEITAASEQVRQAKAALQAARNNNNMANEGPRKQEIDAAKGQVDQASAALKVAQNSLSMAQEGPRKEELAAAREQFRQSQAGVTAAKSILQQARDAHLMINMRQQEAAAAAQKVAASAGAVKEIAITKDQTRIVSPISGRVSARNCRGGEIIAPGFAILTVTSDKGYWARIFLDESKYAGRHIGEQVSVEIPAMGSTISGKIARVLPAADFASKRASNERGSFDARALELRISLDGQLIDLASGITARVHFPAGGRQ